MDDELVQARAYIAILEAQLADARKATAEFDRRRLAACKEVERLAPLARESYGLQTDLIFLRAERDGLQERLAKFEEEYACLIGCARDNNWAGVSEGLHAYAWDAFLQSRVGQADQRTRWAQLWKCVARKYRIECWRLRGILKGERARRKDAEQALLEEQANV